MQFISLTKKTIKDTSGFTLIEIVIVIVVISILFMVVTPRVSRIVNTERDNFALFTGLIAKTFDDSFLHNTINYLVIHLPNPELEESESESGILNRHNAVSVLNIINGSYVENKRKTLKWRKFSPSKFLIEEIVRPNGEKLTSGNVWIPFYPQGYSDNVIIHILVNGAQKWSIKINKYIKEPKVLEGYVTYQPED
jgi:prepilin-type N-terminal cleavage/methylation domain-containing protein